MTAKIAAVPWVLLLGLVATRAVASSSQPCSSLLGEWTNELKSKMLIDSEDGGILKGVYQTATSSRPPLPPPRPLRGYVTTGKNSSDNALFTFNVNWPNFSSMTTWIGQCSVTKDGKEVLTTLWILASRKEPDLLWASNNVNTDVFTRTTPPGQGQPIPGERSKEDL